MGNTFNSHLANQMYGVSNEKELRDKLYGTRAGITQDELSYMIELLSSFKNPIYGEIGVYFGGTFANILNFLKSNKESYKAYGFDLFEDLELQSFDNNNQTHELKNKWNMLNVAYRDGLEKKLIEMGYVNFTLVKGSSNTSVDKCNEIFDLFFIDGNHTYRQVKMDFNSVIGKCKSGSVIVFDNSSNDIPPDPRYVEIDGGPWKLCQELKSDSRVKFLNKIYRSTYFKVS